MEPNAKLDALGDELESLVAGLSQSPQQFLLNPGKVTVLSVAQGGPVNRKARARPDRRGVPGQRRASQGAHGRDAGEENSGGSCRRRASQPQKDWPPDTGGLRLTFWFEKEFTPPEDQTKALTASVAELVQKKKPSVTPSSWKPRQ